MDDVIFDLEKYKNQKTPFVLCIVTEAEGSTPREAGAKMLVFADGSIKGTIGGGAIERKAIEIAQQVLKRGLPHHQNFELEDDVGMICGGRTSIYFEPMKPQLSLFIFGAGHVGREVGNLAHSLGFHVCFVDNRPEIYKEFDSSYAQCIVGEYIEVAESLELKFNDMVLITTQGHAFDGVLLEALAPKQLLYLGMIGSKRKVGETTEKLLAGGKVTKEQLALVDMPVGIPIKAETPREIAISIAAKLIDVKNLSRL